MEDTNRRMECGKGRMECDADELLKAGLHSMG